MARGLATILAACLGLSGCELPRDRDGSLPHIESGGKLRVGAVHAPPWVVVEGDRVGGIESALLRRWAAVVRLRDIGHVFFAEVFVTVRPGTAAAPRRVREAMEGARDLDGRLHDVTVAPVDDLSHVDEGLHGR